MLQDTCRLLLIDFLQYLLKERYLFHDCSHSISYFGEIIKEYEKEKNEETE